MNQIFFFVSEISEAFRLIPHNAIVRFRSLNDVSKFWNRNGKEHNEMHNNRQGMLHVFYKTFELTQQ